MPVHVIEANVHGLTIGSDRPEAHLNYLAVILVGLLYGVPIIDNRQAERIVIGVTFDGLVMAIDFDFVRW
jgi:hypothetical protein